MNQRRDILTSKQYDREELVRIAIQKNGDTTIDKNFNKGGRGIYIHPTSIKKALEKGVLDKNIKRFNGNIKQIIDLLNAEVENG